MSLHDEWQKRWFSEILGGHCNGFAVKIGRLSEATVGDHAAYAYTRTPALLKEMLDWLLDRPEDLRALVEERDAAKRLVESGRKSSVLREQWIVKFRAANTEEAMQRLSDDLSKVRDGLLAADLEQVRKVYSDERARVKSRDQANKDKEPLRN